jgi:hypothetical protein
VPQTLKHLCGSPQTTSSRSLFPFPRPGLAAIFFAALCFLALLPSLASPPAATPQQSAQAPRQGDPDAFVRQILDHECDAELHDHALWSYREVKEEEGKAKQYTVYQTKQGEIGRLTAVNDQPLSPAQAQAEDARIDKLIRRSSEMRTQQRKKAEDGDRARNLLKTFPDAFRFQFDGREGELVRLKFTPNPKFHAEGHEAQVFHHMEGTILLDPAHQRLVAISGKLTSEVKFGFGVFGHLEPGGTFEVKQAEVSPGFWEITMMRVEMHGKALFFKTITEHDDEAYSDFKRVPDNTSLQQAAAQVKRAASGD